MGAHTWLLDDVREKSFEKDIGCKGPVRNARMLKYYYLLLTCGAR